MKKDYRTELEAKLREKPGNTPRGIYIHIPYCDRICTFCNMNRMEWSKADPEGYTDYAIGSVKSFAEYAYIREREFDAVYFGGGTPTVLGAERLKSILKAVQEYLPLKKDCEITVESTLHNLDAPKVSALAECGVNRFSIGVQTFSDAGRNLLGRRGDGEWAIAELNSLRSAFSGVLGIDVIYGYPNQSLEELAFDAETCISSGVDSVSFYSLMIYRASSLAKAIADGELAFERDIPYDRERHNFFYRTLKNAGFSLLELTKLVRPGRDEYRYIHLQYERGDLLPIGAGAGGMLAGFQIYSASPGRLFVSAPDSRYDRYYRILGLLQFGVYDPDQICRELSETARRNVEERITVFTREGFLESVEGNAYALTADGIFWGNNMAAEILKAAVEGEI
jgi:oxygen-independent coproporphyrinogen-3 oxidase